MPLPLTTTAFTRVAAAVATLGLTAALAKAQTDWTVEASNVPETLSGVTYSGGQFVIVGEAGVLLTSPDGETWTPRTTGTERAIRSVTSGNGTFLAVGQSGTAITSTDGITWTARDARTTSFLSSAAFGNGVFVAVGGGGTVRFSADGDSWDFGLGVPSNFLQATGFGGGQFVAAGSSGRIVRSGDGQSWATSTSGTSSYLSAVAYFDGNYYVGGQNGTMLTSPDAITWSPVSLGTFEWIKGLAVGAGKMVAVGDLGTVLVTTDGSTWTPTNSGVEVNINSVTFGADVWVAAGSPNGMPLTGLILKSGDVIVEPQKTYATWSNDQFTLAELGDPTISGPDANPDGDGLTNFEEYAFGTAPKSPTPDEIVKPALINDSGIMKLAIEFQRPVECIDQITYTAEGTTNLENWDNFGNTIEVLSDDGTLQQVRITDLEESGEVKAVRLVLGEG